jgi:uncharacterized protein (DUF4415 family)
MTKEKKTTGTDWERLKRQGEGKEPIDFSDIPELDASFWENVTLVIPGAKTRLTMRIDTDIYRWFTGQGPGYQTRMNAVLRSYMMQNSELRRNPPDSDKVTGSVHEPKAKYSTKGTPSRLAHQLAQLLDFCQRHPDPTALSDALKQYDQRRSKRK